jgi:hypothetical protein
LGELAGGLAAGRRAENGVTRRVGQRGPASPGRGALAAVRLGTRELVQGGCRPIRDRRKDERRLGPFGMLQGRSNGCLNLRGNCGGCSVHNASRSLTLVYLMVP